MYFGPPPQVIDTEVFATVPDKYRNAAPRAKKGKPKCFLEGPSFDRAGNLYCVDIPFGRVFRISPAGEWDLITEYDGEPNGLKIHKDGRIFLADHRNGIMLLDSATGAVTPVIEGPPKQRFKGVNDLIFAANGDLFFTDQGQTGLHDPTGCVYRYTAAGQLQCLIDTIPNPNGLVLNVRENALYVAVTRANAIWRIPFDKSGCITRVGLFTQMFAAGPDGMALDVDGNVLVAHAGHGRVWGYSKYGVPLFEVRSCGGNMTTNMAYGGDDMKSLFITDSKAPNILVARMPVAGRRMYSHADAVSG
jgi:gluconolactonase